VGGEVLSKLSLAGDVPTFEAVKISEEKKINRCGLSSFLRLTAPVEKIFVERGNEKSTNGGLRLLANPP
jgi:hypothetical protein